MSHRLIPEGAVLTRAYLAIPSTYLMAETMAPNTDDGWDAIVMEARLRKARLVKSLTDSLGPYGTLDGIEENANTQVRIDLRWVLNYPGGSTDTVIESYKDVDRLRLHSEFKVGSR